MTREEAILKHQELESLIGKLIKRKGINEDYMEIARCFISPEDYSSLSDKEREYLIRGEDTCGLDLEGPYEVYLTTDPDETVIMFFISSKDFEDYYEIIPYHM